MPSPSRALLSDLPKGHEITTATFKLTQAAIDAYLASTKDDSAVYADSGLAPPLAVAATALGALLDVIELPPGTLHTGQEVEVKAGISLPATLALSGRVAQRSERAGMTISVLEFEVTLSGEVAPALTGRTTVMMPGGES